MSNHKRVLHVSCKNHEKKGNEISESLFVYREIIVKCNLCGEDFCSVINVSKHKRVLHVRRKNQERKGKTTVFVVVS